MRSRRKRDYRPGSGRRWVGSRRDIPRMEATKLGDSLDVGNE